MRMNVKLENGATLPRYAKPGDAGMDLITTEDVSLRPGETKIVGTGVSVEIPDGYFGLVVPRSGLGSRGINLSNCCGIIDSGYRGEIYAPLHNNHPSYELGSIKIPKGTRIAQLIIVPFISCQCVQVNDLSDSERGNTGFGSSGVADYA